MGPDDLEQVAPDTEEAPEAEQPVAASPENGQPAPVMQEPQPAAPAPVQLTPQQAAQVQQVQQAQQLHQDRTSHLADIGKQLLGAMGKDVNYSIDPQTGKTVTTVTPQKPGELFRRILAGALVGGAVGGQAAAHAGGSPLAGFVGGGGAAVQQGQEADQQKLAQAQQEFKNQQSATKSNQEQTTADLDAQLKKAQTAAANLNTLRLNTLTQQQGYDIHQQHAANGKTNIQPYEDAGLKPTFENIPEAEMQQTIQSNPGASALDWEPVGVKESIGPDGNHHFEYQYSAYDPKGKVPLSASTLDMWKKDGFLDTLGANASDVLQPDKQLDASQYIALKNKHTQFQVQKEQQRQQDFKVSMDNAKLSVQQSLAAQHTASANNSEAKTDHLNHRTTRAGQTAEAGAAGDSLSKNGDGGNPITRAADSVVAGYNTLDDIVKGMRGKEAAAMRAQVQDYILKQNPKYDFVGQGQEAKEFNSIPVQTKLKTNVTLSGSDGKSGLLGELQDAVHKAGLTKIPALNDVQAWTRIESGSPAGVTAHQLMNDVAEQYGAIFAQGGATSDAKIKLAQENFPKNFNNAQVDEAVRAARIALGSRMRSYADHNRFVRSHYGSSIPVRIQDDNGRVGTTTMDKVDDYLAKNPKWKRLN